MERLGFGRTEMEHLWTVLSAVLNLGNVQILPDPSKPVGATAITREQPVHVGIPRSLHCTLSSCR